MVKTSESITRPPNYSAAVPVKWSQIRSNSQSQIGKEHDSQTNNELDDTTVRNYSQSDPLGIFPTRNITTERFGGNGQGSVDIRDKYPQLFLANHLAQVKNNEAQYNNNNEKHHSSSSPYSKVINMILKYDYKGSKSILFTLNWKSYTKLFIVSIK